MPRGLQWLLDRQLPDGSWGDRGKDFGRKYNGELGASYPYPLGPTALALHALLVGQDVVTPAARRGLGWLADALDDPARRSRVRTYELATSLLALLAAQERLGPRPTAADRVLATRVEGLVARLPADLVAHRDALGWRYRPGQAGDAAKEDVSATQFAVLALAAARAAGAKVAADVFLDAAAFVLRLQSADGPAARRPVGASALLGRASPGGAPPAAAPTLPCRARGFRYTERRGDFPGGLDVTGIRTAAGVTVLALTLQRAQAEPAARKRVPPGTEQAVLDGLAWLRKHWGPWYDPPGWEHRPIQWLYAMERAMDVLGEPRLGRLAWFDLMALEVLDRQRDDGSWDSGDTQFGERGPVIDTAFALLFLRRATLRDLRRPEPRAPDGPDGDEPDEDDAPVVTPAEPSPSGDAEPEEETTGDE